MSPDIDEARHPFLKGLSKHRGAPPTVVVIFGASGDLTARKLVPAIFNLGVDNLLPGEFHLIGFGRKPIADEDFRVMMDEAIAEHSRRPLNKEIWERVRQNMSYHSGGYDEAAAFDSLAEKINQIEKDLGRDMQRMFYVSTPPSVFEPIIENLGSSGMAQAHVHTKLASKVVIEKPFGRDLESARELNKVINGVFEEPQVYRIDHYLGKETVQDLLVQRFSNSIFEPLWNREYIDCVQITVAESLGVGSRGGYYDTSGALRDMIQNHTMQLVALTAMEPPVSLDPESIRDEKVKVIKAIQPLKLDVDGGDVVRARYTNGLVKGEPVKGYAEEQGIPEDSSTETYAAMRLAINNWRWQGVPFYIRSGKRMARRASEIAIQFKRPPGILFSEGDKFNVAANTMVISIQPDEGVTIVMNSKIPGLETRTQPVKMHFRYSTTFGSNTPEAYERLILDAMVGDSTLFIRGDETEASWKLVTPVLEDWEQCGVHGLKEYTAGSWGPLESERLLWERGHQWRRSG
ncbi:glucose-6-phosphate dehydrogenase [Coraliomargarita sp. SDUM461004]|uniref:Glucose-6-phosphate 1-dehydrogenase n=2 Tax=Coraliomargaritaceae TaxID=3056371 RepID=A0ABU1AHY2_9BACT|nr:glucose-6-phosphate dehydrogenase [Coraliomargarita sp. SDUM461004]MDQ8194427.1 glucose-6-phosphate dehydrogenase [Coraliomargarita sp. SDUM461004]